MENKEIKRDGYRQFIDSVTGLISSGTPASHSGIVQKITEFESANKFLSQKEYKTENDALYSAVKEKIIIPMLNQGQINLSAVILADAVWRSGYRLPKSPADEPLLKKISNDFDSLKEQSKGYIKYNIALALFIAEAFKGDGKDAKTAFLKRITSLPLAMMKADELKNIGNITKKILDKDFVTDFYISTVFKGSFWNKDLFAQKTCLIWLVPMFWNSFGAEQEFKKVYPSLLAIFTKAIKKNNPELVFTLHYYLSHIHLNLSHSMDEFRQFNEDVEKPLSEYISETLIKEYGIKPCEKKTDTERKKIGFVYDRIVANSPTKLLYSYLEILIRENPQNEYYLYDIEYVEKSDSNPAFVEKFIKLGVKYVSAHKLSGSEDAGSYYEHFKKTLKLREKIIEDQIDELIMCNNREQFSFLFASRTAPVQTYWCHGNFEYNVRGIDRRIAHFFYKHPGNYEYEIFLLRQSSSLMLENFDGFRTAASAIRFSYGADTVVFGTIGRYVKLEGEGFLESVAEILRLVPNSVYIACGAGGTDNILKKVRELGIENRVKLLGWVETRIFVHVIDIYLATFPASAGEALAEFLFLNKEGIGVYAPKVRSTCAEINQIEYVYKAVNAAEALSCKQKPRQFVSPPQALDLKAKLLKTIKSSLEEINTDKADEHTDELIFYMLKYSDYDFPEHIRKLYITENIDKLSAAENNSETALTRLFIRNLFFALIGETEKIHYTLPDITYNVSNNIITVYLKFAEHNTALHHDKKLMKLFAETAYSESKQYKMTPSVAERFLHMLIYAGETEKAILMYKQNTNNNILKQDYAAWLAFTAWCADEHALFSFFSNEAEDNDYSMSDISVRCAGIFLDIIKGKEIDSTNVSDDLYLNFPTEKISASIIYKEYFFFLTTIILQATNNKNAEKAKLNTWLKSSSIESGKDYLKKLQSIQIAQREEK